MQQGCENCARLSSLSFLASFFDRENRFPLYPTTGFNPMYITTSDPAMNCEVRCPSFCPVRFPTACAPLSSFLAPRLP